ncbi:MAG: hypothetical protein ACK5HR_01185 [Mycoplasmatales bacterium]
MRIYSEVNYQGQVLRGFHDKGNDETVIIITHGIGGNKLGHKFIFRQFADFCVQKNLSVLRYDFLGSGESDGLFETTKHSEQVAQVELFIQEAYNLGYQNIVLASTTIGCYGVWHAGIKHEDITCYVNWNPILNYDRYEINHKKHALADGTIPMKGLFTLPTYVTDLAKLKRQVPKIVQPVLILQGELDNEYCFGEAQNICKEYKWSYKAINKGNHLWEGTKVRTELFTKTVNFVQDVIKS